MENIGSLKEKVSQTREKLLGGLKKGGGGIKTPMPVAKLGRLKYLSALQPYLPAIGGTVLSIVLVVAVIVPRFKSITQANQDKKTALTTLNGLRERSERLADLLSRQAALRDNLELVDGAIPTDEEVPALMTQVQEIASESGVLLQGLHFGLSLPGGTGADAEGGGHSSVSLQAEAIGTFTNLTTFLENLEGASRIVTVESLRFNFERADSGVENIRSVVVLKSFYIKDPGDATGTIINLDLTAPQTIEVLETLKELNYYEVEVTSSAVGKSNPFSQ